MPAIDHLVYAVPDLDPGVEAIATLTGVEAVAGGAHPGAGTRNALLSFDDSAYLEIIAVDPEQPDHRGPRPFGVDGEGPPRLASFAVHPVDGETIESVADRILDLGFDPGPVTAMSRRRPDGVELSWRLTRAAGSPLGLANPASDGVIPFVIDWGPTPTPARSTPHVGRLVELRITHPDPAVVDVVRSLDLELSDGEVTVAGGERCLVAAIELAGGRTVELR
ncbi:MAG: VOC family protein [Acidimicrobiia bacterium]|nr:VOC family protein [Acidimicrobiia bacterium]